MELKVNKKTGMMHINSAHVVEYMEQKVEMVPGVVSIGKSGFTNKLIKIINLNSINSIKITPIATGVIGVEVHAIVASGINFTLISEQIQEIIIFSVEKKYGIKVSFVDVIVEGTDK